MLELGRKTFDWNFLVCPGVQIIFLLLCYGILQNPSWSELQLELCCGMVTKNSVDLLKNRMRTGLK